MDNITTEHKSFLTILNEEMIADIKKAKLDTYNKPYNIAYRSIIERASKFYNSEFKNASVIDASIVFEYMLWGGYFSKEKCYLFSSAKRKNNVSNYGADIICGTGVCKDNCVVISDLLNALGYDAIPIVCYANNNGQSIGTPYGINRNVSTYEKRRFLYKLLNEKGFLSSKMGNHAMTLCRDADCVIPIDPTNLVFVNNKDSYTGNVPDTTIEYSYKPTVTGMAYGIEQQKIEDMLKLSVNSYKYSFNEMRENYKSVVELCETKKSLFDDYYRESEEDINQVVKTLTKK